MDVSFSAMLLVHYEEYHRLDGLKRLVTQKRSKPLVQGERRTGQLHTNFPLLSPKQKDEKEKSDKEKVKMSPKAFPRMP
ncbi:hypothetical protein JEQ12_017343 [Ovis aries]|uniref:Uncharacterized protein n=1 Tax=Ovis aries TaxID=9940 RepID=A0A836A1P2_SHEEP|nr:hypothetical protein JEQ12_017343 [Ovis aries]